MRGDKRKFVIALLRKVEDTERTKDVKAVRGRLVIYDDKQLNRWENYFTTIFNRIPPGEVAPLMDVTSE